jgi:GH24 family phage-related lysozyme (muramidase)
VNLSSKGAAFIAAWEGYRPTVYADTRGFATIGVGHLLHESAPTAADKTLYWSHAVALAHLQHDAEANGLEVIRQNIKVPLTQAQVDALCSLCFNTGPGALEAGHDLTNAVNSKPSRWNPLAIRAWHNRVSAAMMEWAHPPELERRRRSEGRLFATGFYSRPLNSYSNE